MSSITRVDDALDDISPALRRFLAHRSGVLAQRLSLAEPAWRVWGHAQLFDSAPRLRELGDSGVELREGLDYDGARDRGSREQLGQFFTPPALADLLVGIAGVDAHSSATVLDPACGAGSVLLGVCRARFAAGATIADVLGSVEGWDRDELAAWTCRAELVAWALDHAREGSAAPAPLEIHGGVDALQVHGRPAEALREKVAAVVTNPPYLEAKWMRRAEPGLRERLRERFDQLSGAFDLYMAFCWLALDLVGDDGRIGLLLPNKVLQGRYAAGLRHALLPRLTRIADLSRMKPRPFPGTGVYPILLGASAGPVSGPILTRRVDAPADLARDEWSELDRELPQRVGGEVPLFVPFRRTMDLLVSAFDGPRLGEVASVASTCSFHRKGLRERFVARARPRADGYPYLGGLSRARRTEVAPFQVRWEGFHIHYDQRALKEEHRNPLPNLERTFLRPKIIFCQHGLRVRPVADAEGVWVTKDTYPVAWPNDPAWSLHKLLAVMASTPFTALYNTVYQGIVVGGETYHYLPAFLRPIPVPHAGHPAMDRAAWLAAELSAADGAVDPDAWADLDRAVCAAWGFDEGARQRMADVHLRRVGAESPS